MSGNVLIYTNNIIAASETFVRNPPLEFARYTPYFIGSLREYGLDMPEERVITANGAGLLGRIRQRFHLQFFGNLGVAQLSERLSKLQPLLLQAHFGHASVYAMDLVEKLGIPFIAYYHGIDATAKDETFLNSRYTRPYIQRRDELKRKATLFLTQSDFLKNCLIEQGFPEEKIVTHYVGTSISDEAPLPLSERGNYVLFTARLTKKKGTKYLIQAMKIVQEKYPDLKLVIVGDGSSRPRLEEQAADELVNYEFVGWQNQQQVAEWMKKARIFCVPSVLAPSGDAEGFGMVFVEAQRWGTPVVSHAHGGIVESVAHDETGLLANEGDVAALAKYIIQLVEDDDLWQRFSQRGYERVKQEFDVRQLAHKLEAIYDKVLAGELP